MIEERNVNESGIRMLLRRLAVGFTTFFLLFLVGCQQGSDDDTSSDSIVEYEYLSLDEEYSDEVNDWLKNAKDDNEAGLYHLSSDDGSEYVYGKGYNQAKVSYTYEDVEGKINNTIKATLLEGESNDEVLISITHNTDVEEITIVVTDDVSDF